MILFIVVMSVRNATMFHQNTQKLKNGKENAAHTFATPFLIFATACIPIHLNAWKEQTLLLIAVIRVWIVLWWILFDLYHKSRTIITINVPQSFATQFTMHALKPIIPKKNAKKLQMTLLTVAKTVTHALLDRKLPNQNGTPNVTLGFATQWSMCALMFTPIPLGVRKEPM
jgi:hypothetical protein